MSPPVPQHPGVKLGNVEGTASIHDELGLSWGHPVVEVVQCKCMSLLNINRRPAA